MLLFVQLIGLGATRAAMAQQDTTMRGMRMPMPGAPQGSLLSPMERMGSGTTWIPDAVSLPARHGTLGGWDVMLHGFLFGQFDYQSGPRGDDQWGSLNWAMLMGSRSLAGGTFQARTMLSLDPWTVSGRGYPLLLQSGESFEGAPIVDRQHPHDFLMEVALLYDHPITSTLGAALYVAPSGEPALGPVAFMHRPSAMDDLIAPLSHHWQDATHISFGVVTAGLFTRRWKLEGSIFNGREPNEERWDIDRIKLDSYSGRLTVNPDSNWSLAVGHGSLESPEASHPEESVRRTTASVLHGRSLGMSGQWSSSLIWGMNAVSGHAKATHSVLAESEAVLDVRHTLFGRLELVQKSAEELAVAAFDDDRIFDVAALSIGAIREVARGSSWTLGLGARGSLSLVPSDLEPYYGSRTPRGVVVFGRLRPVQSGSMAGMPDHKMED
jgi:hypothetical protein